MSTTLYRKYRPQQFSEVIGQIHIIKTITNALTHNRIGQAYLFTGPRGTGKTTTARLLAKSVTCSNRSGAEACLTCSHCIAFAQGSSLDVIEIDAASNTGVDNIRELRDSIKLLPTQAPFKVYIIDEVHMLSIGAFNALLKTLEEPPKHVVFILATTSLHKVPATILSRCQRFDFSRLPLDHIIKKLSGIAKSEKVRIDTAALEMIALASEGGMRDAESLLMQVISLENTHITSEEVSSILGITDQQKIEQCIQYLAQENLETSIGLIQQLVENGTDLYIFANSLLHSLRQMLLISVHSSIRDTLALEMTQEHLQILTESAGAMTTPHIIQCIDLISIARKEIRLASIPQLPLEIAVVKYILPERTPVSHDQIPPAKKLPASAVQSNTSHTAHVAPSKTVPPQSPHQTPSVTDSSRKTLPPSKSDATSNEMPTDTVSSISDTARTPVESVHTIHDIKQQWPIIIDTVRKLNSSLALTLNNCQPLSVDTSGAIILGAKFPMYKDKINAIDNKLTVESAFDTILKSKTRIQIVLDTTDSSSHHDTSSASTANPLVAEAMSILGGEIVT